MAGRWGLGLRLAALCLITTPALAAPDAGAEVAAVLFAASATQAAITKSFDAKLRAQASAIAAMKGQVQAGKAHVADLTAEEEKLVAQLAANDHAYAESIEVFRHDVTDIAATPEGLAALARFNAGDEVGAIAILDRLRAADDRARARRDAIESAVEARRIAGLALEARKRGKLRTADVICRFEEVVRLDPDQFYGWLPLTDLLRDGGRQADALHAAREATRTAQGDFERSMALDALGDALEAQDDLSGARRAYEEALVIARRLAAAATDDDLLQVELFGRLYALGALEGKQGDPAGEQTLVEEALAIARRLPRAAPSQASLQELVVVSLLMTATDIPAPKNVAAGDKKREEALVLVRRLLAADPGNTTIQAELAATLEAIGSARGDHDDPAGARRALAEALLVERSLVATDPGKARYRSNLAGALEGLGDLQASQKDLAAAGASFKESLALERGLAAGDPADIRAAHEVAVNLRKLGNVLRLQDNSAGARASFEEGLAIGHRLTAAHPGDSDFELDVWSNLYGLARVSGSGVAWRDVIAAMEAADRKGLLLPADRVTLEKARQNAAGKP